MTALRGSGSRDHAIAQSQRLQHLADTVEAELLRWIPSDPLMTANEERQIRLKCSVRIAKMRREREEIMCALEHDRRRA